MGRSKVGMNRSAQLRLPLRSRLALTGALSVEHHAGSDIQNGANWVRVRVAPFPVLGPSSRERASTAQPSCTTHQLQLCFFVIPQLLLEGALPQLPGGDALLQLPTWCCPAAGTAGAGRVWQETAKVGQSAAVAWMELKGALSRANRSRQSHWGSQLQAERTALSPPSRRSQTASSSQPAAVQIASAKLTAKGGACDKSKFISMVGSTLQMGLPEGHCSFLMSEVWEGQAGWMSHAHAGQAK